MNADEDICDQHILRRDCPDTFSCFVSPGICFAIALVAIMTSSGCMSEAVVPFEVHDAKTESAVLSLQFQMDRNAERELGDCLMMYRIGSETFVAHHSDDRTVIAMVLPGESCRQISINTAGAYWLEVRPNEPGLASIILSHSIALSVDKVILPLLQSDSRPRHDRAIAIAKAFLEKDSLVVTGRLKYGSRFTGSLRLTPEGRQRFLNALGLSRRGHDPLLRFQARLASSIHENTTARAPPTTPAKHTDITTCFREVASRMRLLEAVVPARGGCR